MRTAHHLRQTVIGAACTLILATLLPVGSAHAGADKPKPYPLKTCLVTGEKLGGMGNPYVFTYQDREIKLCCKGCLKAFNKEPAKYIKILDAAEKTARNSPKPGAPAKDADAKRR